MDADIVDQAFLAFRTISDDFDYQYLILKSSLKHLEVIIAEKITLLAMHMVDNHATLDYVIPKDSQDDPASLGRLYMKELQDIGRLKGRLTILCSEMWRQSSLIEGRNEIIADLTRSYAQDCQDRLEYRGSILQQLSEKKRAYSFIV